MNLNDALVQLDAIHTHVARAETFRGYRSASVGTTALLACIGAAYQARFVAASSDPTPYLQVWLSVAAASLAVVAVELLVHCWRAPSEFARRQTWQAVAQFLPCIAAGAMVTWGIAFHAPLSLHLLPGLWAILFSLGVFSSLRQLPREVLVVGVYYMLAGMVCLSIRDAALAPWGMAATFGVGQALTAAILYWTLERRRG